jgi:LL-diaminopimelate aminotransferase
MRSWQSRRVRKYSGSGHERPSAQASQQRSGLGRAGPLVFDADQSIMTTKSNTRAAYHLGMSTTSIRSERLKALPPYLFAEIDRKRKAKVGAGADVINLGIGDPDCPTPDFIIGRMAQAIRDPSTHRYPYGGGIAEFRQAAARFMLRRFGVQADPNRHILACIGSKDGLAHLPLAVVNPGDPVLIPRPAYPVYVAATTFAGGVVHPVPLRAENGWLPDFDAIPADVADRAKIFFTNYPNNPTAACVDESFFEDLIGFTSKHGIIALSDQAYSEIYFERMPPSLWQARSARLDDTLGIEFHSLSKTFNMTGWRLAFAVGHPDVISALSAVKDNCDSGQFAAVQHAGVEALENIDHEDVVAMRHLYRERRDAVIPALRGIGCEVDPPEAGFFVWARTPPGPSGSPLDSMEFCSRALEEADVVIVPGAGFAEEAKHFFRVALTVDVPRLEEAVQRLGRIDWST